MEMWVQILELNENGEYMPVEVVPARDVRTGGIFQLKQVSAPSNTTHAFILDHHTYGVLTMLLCIHQGQSRRVQVEVRSVQDSGTMPLIAEIILGVSIGCVEIRQAATTKANETQEVGLFKRFRS